jgi:hypothetical protein
MAGRVLERGLVFGVLVLVLVVLDSRMQALQAEVEVAAVRSTLGALRTALVLDHLQRQLHPQNTPQERNPFLLLAQIPANYAGPQTPQTVPGEQPGMWLFDASCQCVGYTPAYAQWQSTSGRAGVVWFRVSAPPGPLQIAAASRYTWQDEVLE